ncbi:hypothetical protein BL250_15475 [Erwinia sp. OLTSP20]|uniref:hypothetical protein n=1 Tax=unclassified Erwinia TaxID=2622719 RepID=UPI000C178652|nr:MULTISPECIES: hypothetical protein [unclassified Erwinia]PIJ48608.1 hypothetical protein BV501_16495 [Erwinia sp. OAMSP11]PIJ68962.1 hypothetical protein BK416_15735 [Erwinia sp. OLSSP12]PIJ78824.1 hypothetical protein BLD47_16520 [Erwinia sp. OLCASP19]PIJ79926.1 hypothetical protein BLD46_16385 [Erwinia sp. OLMTSP26]PIJ82044.1 hypothetical protein BLD49_15900 [Erwinia sp. OLMDSP33]
MSRVVISSVVAASLLVTSGACRAAESSWQWQVTPWLWGAGMNGTVRAFRDAPAMPVSMDFGDVLKATRLSAFVDVTARRDRLLLLADLMYIQTRQSGTAEGEQATLDTRQQSATLGAGWRVYQTSQTALDVTGGVQGWQISNQLSLNGTLLNGEHTERFGWLTPVAGLRVWQALSPDWSLTGMAQAGGTGAGRRTWRLTGALSWQASPEVALSAGYRVLRVVHHSDDHTSDVTMRGPLLAVTWQF